MTYLLPGFSAEMPEKKDLLVLTADKDANLGIGALLNRQVDLGIRSITFECRSHPKHDSGVLIGAHDFLRPFLRYFEYALVVFDLEGCGREGLGRAGVERKIHENLTANGWQGRCEVVAINPELESWVWDETLRVAPALGWDKQRLADWLRREEFLAGTTGQTRAAKGGISGSHACRQAADVVVCVSGSRQIRECYGLHRRGFPEIPADYSVVVFSLTTAVTPDPRAAGCGSGCYPRR